MPSTLTKHNFKIGFTKRTKHGHQKVGTDGNPASLYDKYLDTTKIKKHAKTMGLHDKVGSIKMKTNHHPKTKYTPTPLPLQDHASHSKHISYKQGHNPILSYKILEVVSWVIRHTETILYTLEQLVTAGPEQHESAHCQQPVSDGEADDETWRWS
eukprot:6491362-Amphidinium_carterae.3